MLEVWVVRIKNAVKLFSSWQKSIAYCRYFFEKNPPFSSDQYREVFINLEHSYGELEAGEMYTGCHPFYQIYRDKVN